MRSIAKFRQRLVDSFHRFVEILPVEAERGLDFQDVGVGTIRIQQHMMLFLQVVDQDLG